MKKEILICDFCKREGHDPKAPSEDCIKALFGDLEAMKKEIDALKARQHITIPVTPKDQNLWPERTPAPWYPPHGGRDVIVD